MTAAVLRFPSQQTVHVSEGTVVKRNKVTDFSDPNGVPGESLAGVREISGEVAPILIQPFLVDFPQKCTQNSYNAHSSRIVPVQSYGVNRAACAVSEELLEPLHAATVGHRRANQFDLPCVRLDVGLPEGGSSSRQDVRLTGVVGLIESCI